MPVCAPVLSHRPNGKGDGKMSELAKYSLTVHTTVYGEWAEGADEPETLNQDDELRVFDHLTEVADFLRNGGLTKPSESVPYTSRTWLSLPDGTQPHGPHGNYTGKTEAVTARAEDGFTEREWSAVVASVSAR